MPHAWEVQRSNSCLIAIVAIPMPGGPAVVSLEWAVALSNLEKPKPNDLFKLKGLPWDVARTQAAIQCLNGGYEWLFQIDSDVVAPPDTITRLMKHKLPIVSGLYHQRFPTWNGIYGEYLPCMFNEVSDGKGGMKAEAIKNYTPGSLVEAHYVPAGCLLVHRSVFQKMAEAGIKRFFNWTMHADAEPPGTGKSEDFFFCSQARALGYKIFCDCSIVCVHEAGGVISEKGLLLPKL